MTWRIVSLPLQREEDVVTARQRAREVAGKLGFDLRDQTRIATSVSEITRNAISYGKGGAIEFYLDDSRRPQALQVVVKDNGGGIQELDSIMQGRFRSPTGMGMGIVGARRLMDHFEISTGPTGTTITLSKNRPGSAELLSQRDLVPLAKVLAVHANPLVELRQQNSELLQSLQDVTNRSEELEQLTLELENTNRGVVALHAELETSAQELRNASEMKTRFLANMSHEFRTPLNSILALSRILLDHTDGVLGEEQEKQVRYIAKAAAGLTELVNDLLDIAKVEAGKIDVTPTVFTVSDLFGALRGLLKPLRVNEGVELSFQEPKDLPPLITDEPKVTQILRNFISNALKYTLEGSVVVSAQATTPGRILFTVRDTGIGIPNEYLQRIFEEFEQVPGTHQNRMKGTGLGLPLSRRFASLLGGSVAVDSQPGAGSTFFLELPLVCSQSSLLPDPTRDRASGKKVVLIADDEEAFRYVMRRMLDTELYDIVEVHDGEAALSAIASDPPDVVILDLSMPKRDGFSVLDELDESDRTRGIPVIVSTSLVLSERDRQRLARSKAILSKSALSVEAVSAVIARVLSEATDERS